MRLRRIRGQVDALERAVEAGTECSALLQQIAALRGATNGLMAEVLDSHLRELFVETEGEGPRPALDRKAEVEALMKMLRTYLK